MRSWDQLTMWPLKIGVANVAKNPHVSICATTQEHGITHVRVWRIVNAEGLYPYKLTPTPELLPGDVEHRMFFCNWFILQAQVKARPHYPRHVD